MQSNRLATFKTFTSQKKKNNRLTSKRINRKEAQGAK